MRGRKPPIQEDDEAIREVRPAPDWLPPDARVEWDRVFPLLVARRILTEADIASLENYCLAVGQVRQAQLAISQRGLTISNSRGTKVNPAVRIQEGAINRARLLAAELGLTPVSRSRRSMVGEADDDLLTW